MWMPSLDINIYQILYAFLIAVWTGTTIDEAYWLSGSDMIQERDWRWLTSDGHSVPMVYTNWLHGRPDNVGGNQNCLSLHFHRGKSYWDDENCNTLHSFICETA